MMAKKRDMERIDIPKQKTPKRELPKVDRYNEIWNPLDEFRKHKKDKPVPAKPSKY